MNEALRFLHDPWPDVDFTDRQREVLNLACRGMPAGKIAERLGITRTSIYSALNFALKKINDADNTELTVETLVQAYISKLKELLEKER